MGGKLPGRPPSAPILAAPQSLSKVRAHSFPGATKNPLGPQLPQHVRIDKCCCNKNLPTQSQAFGAPRTRKDQSANCRSSLKTDLMAASYEPSELRPEFAQ